MNIDQMKAAMDEHKAASEKLAKQLYLAERNQKLPQGSWVPLYEDGMKFQPFFGGPLPMDGQHITLAYGNNDQEAPWLAAGRLLAGISAEGGMGGVSRIAFTLVTEFGGTIDFEFPINDQSTILWKGI